MSAATTPTLIDGKAAAARVLAEVAAEVRALQAQGIAPALAVVLVGHDPASQVYVRNKVLRAEECGIRSLEYKLPADTGEAELLALIHQLNGDAEVNGILVQLPLPAHIDETRVLQAIDPRKDVDGFHAENVGGLSQGRDVLTPCTPAGCMRLLQDTCGDLAGKHAVVIGRSNIVGKPMAALLLKAHCTVTVVHSRSANLKELCRLADIVVAAVGKPRLVDADWLKPGAVVIDVGINRIEENGQTRLVGDVDFDSALTRAAAITPVPGGVGPMTIALLMKNTVAATRLQRAAQSGRRPSTCSGESSMKQRVAIIGAGPCGLAQLRAFQSAHAKGAEIPELVCFEKQSDWGGMWNYTWRTGLDEHGEPVHGSMYRYLWSNGPKECLEFADYSFDEHFGRPMGSYPPREVLWDYIKGRVEKAGVRPYIRFNTAVRDVRFDAASQTFEVTVHSYEEDRTYSETFDYVVVASGHFSTPNVPYFPGFESFAGRVLHAHDFRDALEFKGKDVLIVGGSYSAEDIGSQCYKYGARSITSCYRSAPMGYKWPENWEEKPLLTHVKGSTAFFADGSSKHVDAVILCTGYKHHFDFLPEELRLKTDNRLWPLNLYKGICWEQNPRLMYLGMQDQWYSFNMFDAQAWYARDVILGRIALPDEAHMHAEDLAWRQEEETLENAQQMFEFQGEYIRQLIKATDYPSFDIAAVNATFLQWKQDKYEDIMGYRNKCHRSLMTGTMATPHHTPWLDALDDSLEAYLADEPKAAIKAVS